MIAAILLPAIAGAIRFVAEKLSLEAEVNRYEEALGTFTRAKARLAALAGEDRLRESIVISLGKLALEENESWIRAHRERPLEPIVGH
jgi:hypothetical protein